MKASVTDVIIQNNLCFRNSFIHVLVVVNIRENDFVKGINPESLAQINSSDPALLKNPPMILPKTYSFVVSLRCLEFKISAKIRISLPVY